MFFRISSVKSVDIANSVETVLLNDNRISSVAAYTFFEKTRLRKVDLSVNEMSEIDR